MENSAQQSIRHCLEMLAPFSPAPDFPLEGQRQFYDFMQGLYQGMLAAPEEYYVFSAPYEAYMLKNRQRLEEKRGNKNHYSDSRESTLRNTFQHAIQFYALFFYELGLCAIAEESSPDTLSLRQEDHQKIIAKMEKMHGSMDHEGRYRLLEKKGLFCKYSENRVYYTMTDKPHFMEGLMILCRGKAGKYQLMNYLRLDYKNIHSAPSVEDILLTLPQSSRESLCSMQEKIASLGMTLRAKLRPLRGIISDFQWKVEYCCKGKNIWGFYADGQTLKICLYFHSPDRISAMAEELLLHAPHLLPWYQEQFALRLCKCPYNRAVHLGNIKKRICGLSNRLEMNNPTASDLDHGWEILRRLHGSPKE